VKALQLEYRDAPTFTTELAGGDDAAASAAEHPVYDVG